jgi:hypothetical protein
LSLKFQLNPNYRLKQMIHFYLRYLLNLMKQMNHLNLRKLKYQMNLKSLKY